MYDKGKQARPINRPRGQTNQFSFVAASKKLLQKS